MKKMITALFISVLAISFLNGCNTSSEPGSSVKDSTTATDFGGYTSQEKWGEHLVIIGGCGDCHTPKKMTAQGPADDMDKELAGSLSPALLPAVTNEQIAKGMGATIDQTAWIGPWGKSFSANLTSDSTGIGNWTAEQFITCLRKGVTKGLPNNRHIMPPMPWQNTAQMTDGELKAIFAYLKSTKPVHNVVPQYEPPVAMHN